MNRSHVRQLLSPYIDGRLDSAERERVEAHLAGCADCRLELERLQQVVDLLRALPEVEPPASLRAGVMDRVRELAREGDAAVTQPVWWWRRLRVRPLALAATVLVALFGVGVLVQQLTEGDGGAMLVGDQRAVAPQVMISDADGSTGAGAQGAGGDAAVSPKEFAAVRSAGDAPRGRAAEPVPAGSAGASQTGADTAAAAGTSGGELFAGRKLIQRAQAVLEVPDVTATYRSLLQLIRDRGGFIEEASLVVRQPTGGITGIQPDPPDQPRAHVTARIPSQDLSSFITELERLGTVAWSDTSSQDITNAYIDTEARLRTLRAQEQRYLEILGRANSVDEVIRVESELWRIRGEIEALQGQLQYWDRAIDLATVAIELRPVGSLRVVGVSGGLLSRARHAWYQGLDAALLGIELIIIGAGAVAPWAALALAGWFGYRRLVGARRRAWSEPDG